MGESPAAPPTREILAERQVAWSVVASMRAPAVRYLSSRKGAMVPERTWSAVCLSTRYQRSMPRSRRSFAVASEAM